MPRSKRPPSYRRHKASGQAIVTIAGKDHYLGPYGSATSRDAYAKLISASQVQDSRSPEPEILQPERATHSTTLVELLAAFLAYSRSYYVDRAGRPNIEFLNYRTLLKRLRQFGEDLTVSEFGPRRLREFRQTLIDAKLARTTINHTINRVRAIFKWGVGHELVPPTTWEALRAVEPLRFGKTEALEAPPVKPVSDEFVSAVLPYCSRQVRAMIELQQLTGMRSGEVVIMRTRDIDRSENVWTYTPTHHKTEYRGHERLVFLGPKAQAILRPWLRANRDEFLFSPAEAEEERRRQQHALREVPLSCGNRPGTNRRKKPLKKAGDRYNTSSYGRAIAYALKSCNRDRKKRGEEPIHWHPHQLRHAAATRLRREHGLEVARVVLGHKHAAITEVYAEVDRSKAVAAMERMG